MTHCQSQVGKWKSSPMQRDSSQSCEFQQRTSDTGGGKGHQAEEGDRVTLGKSDREGETPTAQTGRELACLWPSMICLGQSMAAVSTAGVW